MSKSDKLMVLCVHFRRGEKVLRWVFTLMEVGLWMQERCCMLLLIRSMMGKIDDKGVCPVNMFMWAAPL